MLYDLFGDYHSSSESRSSPDFNAPSEAALKEQQQKFDEALLRLWKGDTEDNTGPYKLRAIVESDSWYVPLKSDGSFELLNVKKGQFSRLFAVESKKDGRRTDNEGHGGQLLPVVCSEPKHQSRHYDGRSLVRALPANIHGILIQLEPDEEPGELRKEFFDKLRELATAVELEDIVTATEPIDAIKLRKAIWHVPMIRGNLLQSSKANGCASAFTHLDKEYESSPEWSMEQMEGEKLFRLAADDPDYDGLAINPGTSFGRNQPAVSDLFFSPNLLHRLLNEDRCYIPVDERVVRSREEFDLWLKQTRFPDDHKVIEEKNENGDTVLRATGKKPLESWERTTKTADQQEDITTPPFTIRLNPDTKPGVGKGPSKVLCAGMLALWLRTAPPKGKQSVHNWNPGKKLLFCRLLSEEDIQKSKERIVMAHELLKLIPVNAETIPRQAIRTIEGAYWLRTFPHLNSRTWVKGTIEQSERNLKSFVWG